MYVYIYSGICDVFVKGWVREIQLTSREFILFGYVILVLSYCCEIRSTLKNFVVGLRISSCLTGFYLGCKK